MWRDVSELVRPVRAFWECERNGQQSQIRLDVDLRQMAETTAKLERWLDVLWYSVWAPLLNAGTLCTAYGVTAYSLAGPNIQIVPEFRFGTQSGAALDKSQSAVWNLWGGLPTGDAQRRLYIAFMSANAVSEGLLTNASLSRHQTSGRSLVLGCDGDLHDGAARLIVFRPVRPANAFQDFRPPAWLPVEQIVINTYVDKAPILR